MDADDLNSEETKGSKERKGTWIRKRTIKEDALQTALH